MIFALPVRSETLSFGPKLGVQPPVGSFLSSLLSATYRFKLRDLFPGLSLCPTKPSTCPHPSGSFRSTQASAAFLPSYGPDRLLLLLCLNSSASFSPVSPVPRSELSRVRSPPPTTGRPTARRLSIRYSHERSSTSFRHHLKACRKIRHRRRMLSSDKEALHRRTRLRKRLRNPDKNKT